MIHRIITVGKKSDENIQSLTDEYIKRLKNEANVEYVIISNSDIETESASILNKINKTDYVILCDERGSQLNSIQLSELIYNRMLDGVRNIVWIIGGAYGVADIVSSRANYTISFSKMVFPHQLFRVMLIEQIYRAHNILNGGKYHHE